MHPSRKHTDYFGDAWGIRDLKETFYACSFHDVTQDHSWTCCYRYMVPDDVPFYKKFRATIENYPEDIWGTKFVDWDEDYVSTAYWYQMPGGSDFFKPVAVENRRPWGKVPAPPVVEAEEAFFPSLLASALDNGAVLLNDEQLQREFSRGTAISLGQMKAGEGISFKGPEIILDGPYMVVAHTKPGIKNPASFNLIYKGKRIGSSPWDYGKRDVSTIGAAVFPIGCSELTIRFTSEGSAIFDCFQFQAIRQIKDAVEAETTKIVDSSEKPLEIPVGILWSIGKQIRFHAEKSGDSIELEATIPPGNWNISTGLTRGTGYGNYQAFVNGKPVGLLKGYGLSHKVCDGIKLGTLKGRNGKTRFRFVCTGKHPGATGLALGLDYFKWSRIVVEDAIEGETVWIINIKKGCFVHQTLGDRFSGGGHLWFHPTEKGASFVWPLEVNKTGNYELAIFFTKSWDYAIVRVSLDNKPLGEIDTFAPAVAWGGKTDMGIHNLKEGTHLLKFEIAGNSKASKGILMGVDCITFKRK